VHKYSHDMTLHAHHHSVSCVSACIDSRGLQELMACASHFTHFAHRLRGPTNFARWARETRVSSEKWGNSAEPHAHFVPRGHSVRLWAVFSAEHVLPIITRTLRASPRASHARLVLGPTARPVPRRASPANRATSMMSPVVSARSVQLVVTAEPPVDV
jgi:hypothetical protein